MQPTYYSKGQEPLSSRPCLSITDANYLKALVYVFLEKEGVLVVPYTDKNILSTQQILPEWTNREGPGHMQVIL